MLNIFNLDDPDENNSLYRLVNFLHIDTRPRVIERSLLFRTGDRVSVRTIDETERLMRTNRYLYDVRITPVAYHGCVVDIDVVTRDTWTLNLGLKYSRAGGANTSRFGILDYNFLGTGTRLGLSQTSDPDRHGTVVEFAYPQAFDGWTQIAYTQGHFSDGSAKTATVARPFYALDTRWAASAAFDRRDQVDSIYNAGDVVAKFRHQFTNAEVYGGWSPGLIDGWTRHFSVGATMLDDAYTMEPDETPPPVFPVDHKVRGPFARFELLQDGYVRLRNRDQIARTEFVALSFNGLVQVTRSLPGWGATQSAWLYNVTASDGFMLARGHELLATLALDRKIASDGSPLSHAGGQLRYFAPQNAHASFYAALSGDRIGKAPAPDQLQIGGDTGLRGYPLRYQEGERRALATLEQRAYTDWYPFRLLRVGGAVFYDVGRAWGGVNQNTVNGGWLSDVGIGLRLAFDRTAFGNVLHVDMAVPLDRAANIKSVQFLVKTQLTF